MKFSGAFKIKHMTGAFRIKPMIDPGFCLRLNNWLHTRHCVYFHTPFDPESLLKDETLFGFYSPLHSWDMISISASVDHMQEHGFDPYHAPHLIGTFEEDREQEQDELKHSFRAGEEIFRKTMDSYNRESFPATHSFLSNLSLVNSKKDNCTYLCWDQKNEIQDRRRIMEGLPFWINQMCRILKEFKYQMDSGCIFECLPESDESSFYAKVYLENGEIKVREADFNRAEYEEEAMQAIQEAEAEAKDNITQDIAPGFLEPPEAIQKDFDHYTGISGCEDPLRFFTAEEARQEFSKWLGQQFDQISNKFGLYSRICEDGLFCRDLKVDVDNLSMKSNIGNQIYKELMANRFDMPLAHKIEMMIHPF